MLAQAVFTGTVMVPLKEDADKYTQMTCHSYLQEVVTLQKPKPFEKCLELVSHDTILEKVESILTSEGKDRTCSVGGRRVSAAEAHFLGCSVPRRSVLHACVAAC
eukprot:12547034-Alexandrium_andersonii.AAC.1